MPPDTITTRAVHGIESTLGEITFQVEHKGARLSIFEIRSLKRIKEQIDDLLLLDRRRDA